MFTELHIKNFQKHKKKSFKLEIITTFVGPSEAGKSAIIRALRWLCLNKPRGTSFIRNGAKTASVGLKVDGELVIRSRGKENEYRLGSEQYLSFNNDVPQPVSDHLNVTELNFQKQEDGVFWLSSSPGQVSKELNKIVDLDVIDRVVTKASKRHKDAKLIHSHNAKRLEEARKDEEELAWVPKAMSLLEKANDCLDERREISKAQGRLQGLLASITTTRATLKQNEDRLAVARKVGNAAMAAWQAQQELNGLRKMLDGYRPYDPEKAPLLEQMSSVKMSLESTAIKCRSLKALLFNLKKAETSACRKRKQRLKRQKELKSFEKQHKCPTCGMLSWRTDE